MLEKKAAASPKTGIAAKGECRHETHNQPPHVHSASVSTPTCAPAPTVIMRVVDLWLETGEPKSTRMLHKHSHNLYQILFLTFTQLNLNQMRISKVRKSKVVVTLAFLLLGGCCIPSPFSFFWMVLFSPSPVQVVSLSIFWRCCFGWCCFPFLGGSLPSCWVVVLFAPFFGVLLRPSPRGAWLPPSLDGVVFLLLLGGAALSLSRLGGAAFSSSFFVVLLFLSPATAWRCGLLPLAAVPVFSLI